MFFGISYWILPLFAAGTWFGTLLALLIAYLAGGRPHYPSMEPTQTIAYISDTAAYGLKPLFIAGSAVTVVVFDLTFISERWLRHKGRLAHNRSWVDKSLSLCAIFFAIVGAAGLILLTIFDTYRHPNAHDAFLVVFIAGYVISAIFICAEYQRLGIYFREYRILRISFWMKLAFIFIEVGLAIAFGVLGKQKHYNAAAIVEWTISLIYIFYVASFALDFIPALHSKEDRFPTFEERDRHSGVAEVNGPSVSGGPVYSEGGHHNHHGHTQHPQHDSSELGQSYPQQQQQQQYLGQPEMGQAGYPSTVGGSAHPSIDDGRTSYSSSHPMMYPVTHEQNGNLPRAF